MEYQQRMELSRVPSDQKSSFCQPDPDRSHLVTDGVYAVRFHITCTPYNHRLQRVPSVGLSAGAAAHTGRPRLTTPDHQRWPPPACPSAMSHPRSSRRCKLPRALSLAYSLNLVSSFSYRAKEQTMYERRRMEGGGGSGGEEKKLKKKAWHPLKISTGKRRPRPAAEADPPYPEIKHATDVERTLGRSALRRPAIVSLSLLVLGHAE